MSQEKLNYIGQIRCIYRCDANCGAELELEGDTMFEIVQELKQEGWRTTYDGQNEKYYHFCNRMNCLP